MTKPLIFLSHIHEERELAELVQSRILKDFLNSIEVFRSSGVSSNAIGDQWFTNISNALDKCILTIVLCSPTSMKKQWINFEIGAGWSRKIRIAPICHSGMKPSDLPMPTRMLNGINATSVHGWQDLYSTIAAVLDMSPPDTNFDTFLGSVGNLERDYMHFQVVRNAVSELIDQWPEIQDVFRQHGKRSISGLVWQVKLETIREPIALLVDKGYIDFQVDLFNIQLTGPETYGQQLKYQITLTDRFMNDKAMIISAT